MDKIKILWVDDEVDMLKAHIIYLQQKDYDVSTVNNGAEALELIQNQTFDIVFLDENMPGLSGLETLERIKNVYPGLPVVMITKSEEETIMEEAIGSNIADYLIKPVKPQQIILCLKKNLEGKELVMQKTTHSYQQEFRNIGMEISARMNHSEWAEVYKKLVGWELRLNSANDESMSDVLKMQKDEANTMFARFVEDNYSDWVQSKVTDKPVLSHTCLRDKLFPYLTEDSPPVFLIVLDNFRYDQWKVLQPILEEFYRVEKDEIYYSILPTVTQYARNALFSGLMPSEIEKKYPAWWFNDWDEGTKNQYEEEHVGEFLKRFGKDIRYSFNKVLNLNVGKKLVDSLPNLLENKLNVIVYNFVDMLSHARTEMEIIRELADDEAAYRSLTISWFMHSPLYDIFKFLAQRKVQVLITTDHGSIRVQNAVKVIGDRQTNTNLRFKAGKNLNFNKKDVFHIKNPDEAYLPKQNVSTSYIFARGYDFFAYPNNYNYYANYYRDTFQHGGISMEEVLIPFITLRGK
ncbi:MAG: bifunctional response regulator/alkaline phosphatase family protein [Bacteroidales bacterium]|nr:bifunctional response regulator/alkaline phosphatase family protein [Bacteroidales bacterium]